MGQDPIPKPPAPAKTSPSTAEKIAAGIADSLKALQPLTDTIIKSVSAGAQQERQLEAQLELERIRQQGISAAWTNPAGFVQANPALAIGIPVAIVGAALLLRRKRGR